MKEYCTTLMLGFFLIGGCTSGDHETTNTPSSSVPNSPANLMKNPGIPEAAKKSIQQSMLESKVTAQSTKK
jgi:hypothetical protein